MNSILMKFKHCIAINDKLKIYIQSKFYEQDIIEGISREFGDIELDKWLQRGGSLRIYDFLEETARLSANDSFGLELDGKMYLYIRTEN